MILDFLARICQCHSQISFNNRPLRSSKLDKVILSGCVPGNMANGNNERNNISFCLEKSSIDLGMSSAGFKSCRTWPTTKGRIGHCSASVPGLLEEVKQWAHIALSSSCLVPCSGCSPGNWTCSQCISQQRGLTVQFFYARAGKKLGAKDSSPVSWMALLTRFGIHLRKEFSAIFIHFPSGCISKSQLEFEFPRARLFLEGSFLLKKKESKFWWCALKGYHAVCHAPAPPHCWKVFRLFPLLLP